MEPSPLTWVCFREGVTVWYVKRYEYGVGGGWQWDKMDRHKYKGLYSVNVRRGQKLNFQTFEGVYPILSLNFV